MSSFALFLALSNSFLLSASFFCAFSISFSTSSFVFALSTEPSFVLVYVSFSCVDKCSNLPIISFAFFLASSNAFLSALALSCAFA